MLFFIIFNLIFSSIKVDKTITKNALEIIHTDENWGTNIVSFNVFIKNNSALTYLKDAPLLIHLAYLYLSYKLERLSAELGFTYSLSSNFEFNAFIINIEKNNFFENHKAILDVFLNISIEEATFQDLKKKLNFKNNSVSSYIYSSKSIIYKYNNLDINKDFDLNSFRDFLNYYLSPNNILISISNFKDLFFLKKHIEKYRSKIMSHSKSNNYYDLIQAIPKRILKVSSLDKTTGLKLGLSAARCTSNEYLISELFIIINYPSAYQSPILKYNCYSSFAYFDFSFSDIETNVDDLIANFRINLKQVSKELDAVKFIELKKGLLSKYDLILFSKTDYMYLLAKAYLITNSLDNFLLFKMGVNNIDIEEFKKFIVKIAEANFYEIVIKG